jgi:hypothetical protein
VQFNCVKKTVRKTERNVLWHSTGFLSGLSVSVSSVCLLVRVSSRCLQVLRKLWDSPSELRSSVCERRLERTVLRPAVLSVKTAAAIQQRVTAVLRSITKEAFADSFQKLYERCQPCVVKDGDYFEGQ